MSRKVAGPRAQTAGPADACDGIVGRQSHSRIARQSRGITAFLLWSGAIELGDLPERERVAAVRVIRRSIRPRMLRQLERAP
jgi:hypothetical protein